MKTDDFEKRLQQQPMRQVPGHWRADILKSAASASSPQRLQSEDQQSWLYQLLWPCPQAWGALAAVWVVVLVLNASSSNSAPPIAKVPNEPREVMMAVKLQVKFRAELMSANDVPVAEPPKLGVPQSRIEPSVRIIMV
jgi:hypothetical protein